MVACDESPIIDIENRALDTVADLVVEESNALVELRCVFLFSGIEFLACAGVGCIGGGTACPAFTPDGELRADLVELVADNIHGFGVDKTHEVKAEAVNMVLVDPIETGINNILSGHGSLRGNLISAA